MSDGILDDVLEDTDEADSVVADAHTPGPWRVMHRSREVVSGPDDGYALVAMVTSRNIYPEAEALLVAANAVLIAAAPDMLKALTKAEKSLDVAKSYVERLLQPDSHTGPCGPHGFCDGICLDNARVGKVICDIDRDLENIRAVLAKTKKAGV